MHIYQIWDLVDKFIKFATSVTFNKSWDIELISWKQFEQTTENFDITVSNNFSNSKNEDLLLSYLLPSDKIVNKNNTSSLIELNDNNIEQLIPKKERLVKIPPPLIFRQSIRKEKGMQTTSSLAINYKKMAQIYAFFSKTIYILTILENALQYPN